MNDEKLINVGSIFKKFEMCYDKHRQHECEYCNCKNCVLNITDEEFDLMMEHIKMLSKMSII